MEMKIENMVNKKEIYVIEQPDEAQLRNLCCAFSLGRLWANSTYITNRKGYDKLLFVYVQNGRMHLEFAGHQYEIGSGQAFFIDCDMRQIYGTLGSSCELIFLHFKGEAAQYLYKNITSEYGYVFSGYRAKLIKGCMKEIIGISQSHLRNKPNKFSQQLTNTLFELLNYETEADPVFYNAADLIREAVAKNQPLSVDDIATCFGYSKFYFTKKFTETIGVPPYEFIISERLSLAKKLLINTSMPVGEIALECGFFDASHMANCFKKREGISPTSFRREGQRVI